ncbi:ComEC/Rec2 family competence protein [Amnibacterium endophyticum]|uniref:ComEC/Rec2 family competence protein n=1 Tax=Amnibacterium endophyticum TaxID=2109337 RepID=A0ABW4LG15_9MICO
MSPGLVRSGLLLPATAVWGAALLATAVPGAGAPLLAVAAVVAAVALPVARRSRSRAAHLVVAGAVLVGLVAGAALVGQAERDPPGLETGRRVTATVRVASTGATASRTVLRGTITAVAAVVVLRRAPPADASAVLGSVRGRLRVLAPAPPWEAAAQALRDRFAALTAGLPGDGGALLPGLAIGDTRRVGRDLLQAMRDASLTHLTAVSGANCAVVVLAVLALGAQARLPRAARTALAGAALAGFVVLVTPQPSVVRAAVMTGIGLGCVVAGRRTAGAAALSLTTTVLLLLDPWIAWSAGFVLSVAATAGLLLLAPPLAERLARVMPPRLALLLAVPVAAQAACQPVLVLLQPGIPVLGVLANLLAEPAAPVATVLGLCACLLAPAVPALAAGLALLAWVPAAWIAAVARVIGALPQLGWLPGLAGAALAALLTVLGILALRRRTANRIRLAAATCVGAAVLALGGAVVGGGVGRSVGTPTDWTLAACDVGQGDGLVLSSAGRFAVVDTGREPGAILGCLDRLGVRRIDLLVLTHWDDDHVGAADAVAPRVATALVGPADGGKQVRALSALRAAGARVQEAGRGDVARVGALRLEVLWPPRPLGGVEPGNPASITLAVTGPGPSVLMTGDLGEEAQDALLALGPLPRVDVVKVSHHGSADQSPRFYAAAGAALGIVSAGAGNDYGHPTARLLDILRSTGTAPVRTDQDGMVLVGQRDGRLRLWTEHPVTAAVWTPAK